MSQASEYAGAMEESSRLKPRVWYAVGEMASASIDDTGRLTVTARVPLTEAAALDLAAYIFEVMGEGPASQEWQRTDEEEAPF